jgi:hypothetical protein
MSVAAARGAAGAPKRGLSLVLDPVGPVAPANPAPAAAPQPAPAPAAQPDAEASAPIKRAYPAPAELPTQEGPKGMRYDFNDGCRVHLPGSDYPWRVRLTDLDTGNILFETELENIRNFLTSSALTLVIDLFFALVFLLVMFLYSP